MNRYGLRALRAEICDAPPAPQDAPRKWHGAWDCAPTQAAAGVSSTTSRLGADPAAACNWGRGTCSDDALLSDGYAVRVMSPRSLSLTVSIGA